MDKTAKTIETYDFSAESFESRFMDLRLYQDSLSRFSSLLAPGDRVMDLGCGPGNVSKFLLDRTAGLELTGIDLSCEMIRLAKKNVPQARFIIDDVRKIGFGKSSFDAACAAFCLPFLDDAEAVELIGKLAGVVRPGGLLYLSCMEGTGAGFETASFSKGRELYINYYSESFLTKVFRKAGFTPLDFIRQDYPEPDGSTTCDMIFILSNRRVGER